MAELWLRLLSGPLQVFTVTTTGFCTAEQKSGLPLLRAETQILVFGLFSRVQVLYLILEELVSFSVLWALFNTVGVYAAALCFPPRCACCDHDFFVFPPTPFFALWWCGSGAPFDLAPTWLVPLCDRH